MFDLSTMLLLGAAIGAPLVLDGDLLASASGTIPDSMPPCGQRDALAALPSTMGGVSVPGGPSVTTRVRAVMAALVASRGSVAVFDANTPANSWTEAKEVLGDLITAAHAGKKAGDQPYNDLVDPAVTAAQDELDQDDLEDISAAWSIALALANAMDANGILTTSKVLQAITWQSNASQFASGAWELSKGIVLFPWTASQYGIDAAADIFKSGVKALLPDFPDWAWIALLLGGLAIVGGGVYFVVVRR